jgi:hypothetical protein
MSNIVKVIADVKTELIQRSASKDQLRTMEKEFYELKFSLQTSSSNATD